MAGTEKQTLVNCLQFTTAMAIFGASCFGLVDSFVVQTPPDTSSGSNVPAGIRKPEYRRSATIDLIRAIWPSLLATPAPVISQNPDDIPLTIQDFLQPETFNTGGVQLFQGFMNRQLANMTRPERIILRKNLKRMNHIRQLYLRLIRAVPNIATKNRNSPEIQNIIQQLYAEFWKFDQEDRAAAIRRNQEALEAARKAAKEEQQKQLERLEAIRNRVITFKTSPEHDLNKLVLLGSGRNAKNGSPLPKIGPSKNRRSGGPSGKKQPKQLNLDESKLLNLLGDKGNPHETNSPYFTIIRNPAKKGTTKFKPKSLKSKTERAKQARKALLRRKKLEKILGRQTIVVDTPEMSLQIPNVDDLLIESMVKLSPSKRQRLRSLLLPASSDARSAGGTNHRGTAESDNPKRSEETQPRRKHTSLLLPVIRQNIEEEKVGETIRYYPPAKSTLPKSAEFNRPELNNFSIHYPPLTGKQSADNQQNSDDDESNDWESGIWNISHTPIN